MKKNNFAKLLATCGLLGVSAMASAQLSNTLYFDKYNPRQHFVNPAEQPIGRFYIGMPALSTIGVSAGNSDLTFDDVFKNVKRDGQTQTVLFCDKDANSIKDFLDKMDGSERIFASYRVNLIDFGFRTRGKNYITFTVANRMETSVFLPEEMSHIVFEGMDEGKTYDFNSGDLSLSSTLFTEFAVGFSRKVNDQLNLGIKLKYLYGHANAESKFKNLKMYGSEDKWYLKGDGCVNMAVPGLKITENEEGRIDSVDFDDDLEAADYVKPNGGGFAVDLGATYNILPQLKLAASVNDLGFIRWSKNVQRVKKYNDFVYDGVHYDINDEDRDYFDEYETMLEDMCSKDEDASAYVSWLTAKANLAAEYSLWQDRLGLGLVSRTYIHKGNLWENCYASANFRPWRQLSISATYGLFDGEWNNIGLGMNLNAGPVNLWAAVDNVPLKFGKSGDAMFPSNTRYARVNMGLAFMFGQKKNEPKKGLDTLNSELLASIPVADADGDGIPDNLDKCANTPAGADVDSTGCPIDADKDGVADYMDKCLNTPAGVAVDSTGCPIDSDKDGVPDYLDKCANTPAGAKVDSTGCPVDTDKDGIADYEDNCPEVPGVKANHGCPEVKAAVQKLFKKALNGIQFESGKATIKSSSNGILNQIAKVMVDNPTYKLNIGGHTDNSGVPAKNLKLSQDRADAVKNYLIKKGIAADRLTSTGYGDTKPIANNAKPAGRALNRRVEFEVEFMGTEEAK